MKQGNIHNAEADLSSHLAELVPGETFVLCNRDQAMAEVQLLRKKVVRKPRIGAAVGEFAVLDAFFDPLPEEIINGFSGSYAPPGHEASGGCSLLSQRVLW